MSNEANTIPGAVAPVAISGPRSLTPEGALSGLKGSFSWQARVAGRAQGSARKTVSRGNFLIILVCPSKPSSAGLARGSVALERRRSN